MKTTYQPATRETLDAMLVHLRAISHMFLDLDLAALPEADQDLLNSVYVSHARTVAIVHRLTTETLRATK